MRIALCLSGQPRTWKRSGRWWKNMFQHYHHEVDIFYHMWNYNTEAQSSTQDTSKQYVDCEQQELYEFLTPKMHIFDTSEFDAVKWLSSFSQCKFDLNNFSLGDKYSAPSILGVCSQYYSWMIAANLKRQYEIENNFEYDICIRGRTDLSFESENQSELLKKMPLPKNNTIYTVHNNLKYDSPSVGDLFFYSNSLTFDLVANFYRGCIFFVDSLFSVKKIPEESFFYYLKMLNIDVHTLNYIISPKVVRSESHIQKYGLKHYETS
jgi:hypothetical protein